MKAVILAGGKGRRLLPYTTVFPKPLVPLGDRPILDILLRQLHHYGFDRIVLSVGHLAELIQAYCDRMVTDKDMAGLEISYAREERPLGTAGALSLIPDMAGTFLVVNGDVLTTLDFRQLVRYHQEAEACLTIALQPREARLPLGAVELDGDMNVQRYREKPATAYLASMGVYVYDAAALRHLEVGVPCDFPDLVQRLVAAGEPVKGFVTDSFWLDIGNPEDYQRAQEEFSNRRSELLPHPIDP